MKLTMLPPFGGAMRLLGSRTIFCLALASIGTGEALAEPDPLAQHPPGFVHYMPWFETPASAGNWGYHWTMQTRDPDVIDSQGIRQIASHFYPAIGPYASGDPDVLEYHLLLIKLAGARGILIDFYGAAGSNADLNLLLANSDDIRDAAEAFGVEVGVVLEDRFATSADDVATNLAYLRDHYFNRPSYTRLSGEPLVALFGPITIEDPATWPTIAAQAGEPIKLLPLWNQIGEVGTEGDGEFAWIFENEVEDDHLLRQQTFLAERAPTFETALAVAYPGFDDYYLEGGVGDIIGFQIPHENGLVLSQTLGLADQFASNIAGVQVATFNDFGEGTIIEPTLEFGYTFLLQLQAFTNAPGDEATLHMAFELYSLRKAFGQMPAKVALLDLASEALRDGRFNEARTLLDDAAGPRGDANGDGLIDLVDFVAMRNSFGQYVADYSRGDFNLDGFVDLADFVLLRNNFGN